jgi:hypothetical protein
MVLQVVQKGKNAGACNEESGASGRANRKSSIEREDMKVCGVECEHLARI